MFNFLFGRAVMRWLEKLGDVEAEERPEAENSEPFASQPEPKPSAGWVYPRVERPAMGRLFEIDLAGMDREGLISAGEQAMDDIERLDRQLSHYKDDSDTARLNAHATENRVRLEPRMYQLLKRCAELNAETEGAFDITTGPLTEAWGFYRGEGRVPSDTEIDEILHRVGMAKIAFDDEDDLVHYTVPGLEINLGAVGKGYSIDIATETLKMYGVERAVLDGGQSTIYAIGSAPIVEGERERAGEGENGRSDHQPSTINHQLSTINHQPSTNIGWEFIIKDPRDHVTPIETVYLKDQALSTSGSYEDFFEVDGIRYSHILDPRTGRPVQGMLSVSVIAPNAADSDALSTAFFVMGRERTEEFCRAHKELKVIMMEERKGGE